MKIERKNQKNVITGPEVKDIMAYVKKLVGQDFDEILGIEVKLGPASSPTTVGFIVE